MEKCVFFCVPISKHFVVYYISVNICCAFDMSKKYRWYIDIVMTTVTVHFGTSDEDGIRVCEWEVIRGRHPLPERTWDTEIVK